MNSILPEAIQDKNNLALEQCAIEALDINVADFMICPVENIHNEKVLEALAKEYHILGFEGWNLANTRQDKVNLINNSIMMHARKGTLISLKDALKSFGYEVDIEEYDEYAGRPSHFRIKFIKIYDKGLSDKLLDDIEKLINSYKPATRKIDSIAFYLCTKGAIYSMLRTKTTEKTTIRTREILI